jgi:PAS domain S-box-containing protein
MFGMVIAVSLACVALGTQLLLVPIVAPDSYQLFLGAVAISSIYGGARAGLLTLLISSLGKFYFFMPSNILAVDSGLATRTLLFLSLGAVICWIGGRFHSSEQRLAAVLASVADALIATDTKGRIRFMNPAAEALSGWAEAAAVKRNLFEVIHLRDRANGSMMEFPRSEDLNKQPLLTRIDSNTVLDTRTGCTIPVAGSFSIVTDGYGARSGAVIVLRDITDRRQAEEEREWLLKDIQSALARVKALSGILPICAACKNGLCPECARRLLASGHEQDL